MTLQELVGPGVTLPPSWRDIAISGLTSDSREVRAGYLFAALSGAREDGSRFIADALGRGAAAILVRDGATAPGAPDVPLVVDPDPRRRLALMAAAFFAVQPEIAVAVTGTNGKTSVASFVRQIWTALGFEAASLGTVGVTTRQRSRVLRHTTPEPVELHRLLAELAAEGVTHLAFEASSHGLEQRRLDGVVLKAAGFTNLTRDHLDYHKDAADYFAQKLRLFRELLPDGGVAVADVDSAEGVEAAEVARARHLDVISVGTTGETIRLVYAERDGLAQRLRLEVEGVGFDVTLPLVGGFQASNALVAAGLCIAAGSAPDKVLPALEGLKGALGRLDLAGRTPAGAPVFIDYAHTPDALAKALAALRPYAKDRLVAVFGCGGDRDRGKRPEMGRAATQGADVVYVTDDNPRSESPAAIRREILAGAIGAIEIGDRPTAITEAIASLRAGDVLLIAGKGHETGQIVGDSVIPYSDHDAVAAALEAERAGG